MKLAESQITNSIQDTPAIYSLESPIGLSLGQWVKWAKRLEDQHGSEAIIDSLDADPEFPIISFSNKS